MIEPPRRRDRTAPAPVWNRRAAARARAAVLLIATLMLPASAHADSVRLAVTAGAGGVVKAERWTPVHVVLTSTAARFAGELLVEWGDVQWTRRLQFASPGRRTFDAYLRTSAPGTTVHVSVRTAGSIVGRADVAVRVLPPGEPVVLCVATAGSNADDGQTCTTHTAATALPTSPRGYEAIDRLIWSDTSSAGQPLDRDQQKAYAAWVALRRLEDSGDLGLAPQPARPALPHGLPPAAGTLTSLGLAAYLAAIAACGAVIAVRYRRAGLAVATTGGIVALATGAALALGHAGPATAVHIAHAAVVHQIPGAAASLITIRGLVEFPAADDYTITAVAGDATIERTAGSGTAPQAVDENGAPLIAGSFGLGGRQGFVMEAIADLQPLVVTETDGRVEVTNGSPWPLHDCRFGDGLAQRDPATLAPGTSISTSRVGDSLGPLVTCTVRGTLPIPLREESRPVTSSGSTAIVAYDGRHR